MPNCYEYATGAARGGIGIGVCSSCHAIACPGHGGKINGTPDFKCTGCFPKMITVSAGRPGGGWGGGGGGQGGGGSGGGGSGSGVHFTSSADFEAQLPVVAHASRAHRYAIEAGAVREAIRGLFRLLESSADRDGFAERVVEYARPEMADLVHRQTSERVAMRTEFEDAGGEYAMTEEEYLGQIRDDLLGWLTGGLASWMTSIRPELDVISWLGPDRPVDVPLLADAIGLNRYTWDLADRESPFQRLHLVRTATPEMLVLTELCGQSMAMPAYA
jgi:hypothetical protein